MRTLSMQEAFLFLELWQWFSCSGYHFMWGRCADFQTPVPEFNLLMSLLTPAAAVKGENPILRPKHYINLTDILHHYIERRFHIIALEQTMMRF
jgi:hypothetical protein